MRIRPNPTFLRIVMVIGVLFATGCTDSAQQLRLNFGTVQIVEQESSDPASNRASKLWMRVARQAMENGHPRTAIRFAQKAALASPESDEPLRILAQAYREHSEDGEARASVSDSANLTVAAPTGSRPTRATSEYPNRQALTAPIKLQKKAQIASVSFAERSQSPSRMVKNASKPGAYSIQLAAYVDLDDAVRGKNILTRRLPSDLPELGVFVRLRPNAGDQWVNYRLRSRHPTNRSQALILCKTVMAAGFSCLPVRQRSGTWRLVNSDTHSQVARAVEPSPKTKARVRAEARHLVGKPVALTPNRSMKFGALSQPATDAKGPLFRVQLGAYRDLPRAARGKQILSKSLADIFPLLVILERNGNAENREPINYWVRSQGLWHKRRAAALCNKARSAGHACFLVKTDSTAWRPIALGSIRRLGQMTLNTASHAGP